MLGVCYDAEPRGNQPNGERVYNCEADEEGTRQSRKAVIGVECGTRRFCWGVLRQRRQTNTQTPEVVSKGKGEDRSGTTGTMGKGSGKESSLNIPPKQEARASSVPLLLNR